MTDRIDLVKTCVYDLGDARLNNEEPYGLPAA